MESVDVVLLTMNSERKLGQCLESVYRNVPVNQLIAVDGGSTDHTLEILSHSRTFLFSIYLYLLRTLYIFCRNSLINIKKG